MKTLIVAIVATFTKLLLELVDSRDDKQKQEDALMTAQEEIARLRAKAKFG